jgi:hypothetical protein
MDPGYKLQLYLHHILLLLNFKRGPSVIQYEKMITSAGKEATCCSYGKLVPLHDIHQVPDEKPLLQPWKGYLDNCGWKDGFWTCYSAFFRLLIPKFSLVLTEPSE